MAAEKEKIKLSGVPVSSGIAMAPAFIYKQQGINIPVYQLKNDAEVEKELKRFEAAVKKSVEQINEIHGKVAKAIDTTHADIFKTHAMILQDPLLIDETINEIKKEKMNAEFIFNRSVDKITALFAKIKDDYIFDRARDIKDVAKRVIGNLTKAETIKLDSITSKSIVIAHDLSPSDTVHIDKEKVLGFATEVGGPTSHTAILAKALELPAIVGIKGLLDNVTDGDNIILDGSHGKIVVNPDEESIKKYNQLKDKIRESVSFLSKIKSLPAETSDGYRIELSANIELKDEVHHAMQNGADGIGLFRTEFLYLDGNHLPSEDEQAKVYTEVLEAAQGNSVIFRTLDLGGDKFISHIPVSKELNPYLGLRAIRLCLANPDIFRSQLRAILKASAKGKAKIMFPMISGLGEVLLAKQFLNEAKQEFTKNGIPFNKDMEIGIMIEIPSAAVTADILAKEVDFFSIGTNDLIQYTLAVDRGNENVAHLYEPFHPSVLRLIRQTIKAGHRENIWVGLCGEMAGDPITAVILLGLGIDELSMSASVIPLVKKVIRSIRLSDARKLADELMKRGSVVDIKNVIRAWANQHLQGLLPTPDYNEK